MALNFSAATDRGRTRLHNEDQVIARPDLGLWAVADGAGGHGGGALASGAVAEAFVALPAGLSAAELLAMVRLGLQGVHAALREQAGDGVIASTIAALLLRGPFFAVLWAGDSRVYRLRDGALERLTRDHSLVQDLVDDGRLTAEEAERHPQANVITRAIGQPGEVEIDKVSGRVLPGDGFLLCSDGLVKSLPEAAISTLLAAGAAAEALVAQAVDAGGRDNVSAIVVRA